MDSILNFVSQPWFIVNAIIAISLLEYALYNVRPIVNSPYEVEERFPAFRRYDRRKWMRWRLYFFALFLPIRFFLGVLNLVCMYIMIRVINYNISSSVPPTARQAALTKYFTIFHMRFQLILVCGMFRFKVMKIHKEYFDVLGPDWKPYKGKPATIVSNHSAWIDILLGCIALDFPRFTSKIGILKWPMVGVMASYPGYGTLFLDRAGSKEERVKLVEMINGLQKEICAKQTTPLIMYPEGCTTNNTEMIQFRRGAFNGMYPVQPVTFKYYSPFFQCSHDILDVFSHIILIMCQPYTYCEIRIMPVFQPNEYFSNFQVREGEEKWAAYARAVRKIMAESIGQRQTDQTLEMKFEYKNILYPNKGNKNKSE
ncbi:acyltransferase family protein [Stylonychia lemnae]|uniref:Acyltransferase family protein n=1 Tax=Stylonychia lemnae TaxID=5949 RepID=A0A077ZVH5_STYLE|nr:acyltransferase family protein [Stylonychia lemnae]|eukprot:CDW73629.1 acyltransferase family protein [Stylonychia lemnae]